MEAKTEACSHNKVMPRYPVQGQDGSTRQTHQEEEEEEAKIRRERSDLYYLTGQALMDFCRSGIITGERRMEREGRGGRA